MMNPGDGLRRLQEAIIEGLNGLIQSTAESAQNFRPGISWR